MFDSSLSHLNHHFMRYLTSLLRLFLSSRYRVVLKGQELLQHTGGKFILPNHQALVDPQILFAHVSRYTRVVPVVSEIYFKKPVLRHLFKALGAVPVSDITLDNRDHNTLHAISRHVTEALHNGKNVLLYPSGQIAGQGFEKIFNKQSAWAVASEFPSDARIIGVRIGGLWGSMWSRAWIGKSPDFALTALKAIGYVFANFFFFIPKRTVTIEFYDITDEALQHAQEGKNEFNNYLESFYNANGEEPVHYLKHFFYAPTLHRQLPDRIEESVAEWQNTVAVHEHEFDAEVFDKVADILVHEAAQPREAIHLNANLKLDLNIDSLGLVAVISAIETTFKVVADAEITAVKTVADLCLIAINRKVGHEVLKPSGLHESSHPVERLTIDPSSTIPAMFLKSFARHGSTPFAYDKLLGTSSRKDFLMKAYVVSKILKQQVDGPYVGIMLPALQSTTLLVAATYLAGKTPVMLNWTVGPKVMEHCIGSVNLKQVITARSFYDKVADLLPPSVKDKCVFFEEKVRQATLATKLAGMLAFVLRQSPSMASDDVAVILFTSGSEALPKAVSLTHRNLMADLHGSLCHLNIDSSSIFLSFLPPFHSFGFTILTILPLVTALKIAYTPDPTDSREVLRILIHTRANAILGTPTFLKMLLAVANNDDLKHIRLAVSGAESLHPSVMETFVRKTGGAAKLIEGYGITECSPVLCINPLERQKINSVGTFIKGVDHLIVDISHYRPLPDGKEGMIVVKGDSVFGGYSDATIDSPFVTIDGHSYYKTGDLGYIDADGYLYITGRLKRFIKIAGEMISLPAIEHVLLEHYGDAEKTVLAVEGCDKRESPQIVLFSTNAINLDEANALLRGAGFSNLIKLHHLVTLDEIPVLGTGKTDYKVLKAMIE
jgi:long-chain-fatty-acid--[acyl-carrier-protein] ligase